jgi:predicted membrane protein
VEFSLQLLFDITLTFFFVIGTVFRFSKDIDNNLTNYERTQYACLVFIFTTCGINFIYMLVNVILGIKQIIKQKQEEKAAREKQEKIDEEELKHLNERMKKLEEG